MKLLVCGGAGFIGSAFIKNYFKNNSDSEILNLDSLAIGSNLENLKEIQDYSNYKFIEDNIKNESVIDELVKDLAQRLNINSLQLSSTPLSV